MILSGSPVNSKSIFPFHPPNTGKLSMKTQNKVNVFRCKSPKKMDKKRTSFRGSLWLTEPSKWLHTVKAYSRFSSRLYPRFVSNRNADAGIFPGAPVAPLLPQPHRMERNRAGGFPTRSEFTAFSGEAAPIHRRTAGRLLNVPNNSGGMGVHVPAGCNAHSIRIQIVPGF